MFIIGAAIKFTYLYTATFGASVPYRHSRIHSAITKINRTTIVRFILVCLRSSVAPHCGRHRTLDTITLKHNIKIKYHNCNILA